MPGDAPPRLPDRIKQQLFEASDLAMRCHKKDNQVTCRATITPSTPTALTAIITQAGITDLAAYLQGHARARVCDATLGVACQTRNLRLGRPGNRLTSSGPGFP